MLWIFQEPDPRGLEKYLMIKNLFHKFQKPFKLIVM